MYFLTHGGSVYHVVGDERTGEAPCGARLGNYELYLLKQGKPTPQVAPEKPEGAPLCKNCERHEEG